MFSTPKPTFGQSAGTFGFNSANTTSPFGQNTFGKPATAGFASTSTFGSPAGGSTLFGAPTSTSGGLFGQPAAQTGFGFSQNTSGGLFGNTPAVGGTSLFGQTTPATQTFGTKPAGFGAFGASSTAPVGGLFGPNTQMGTGLFGQPTTAAAGNTSLFGNTTGFGQTGQTGTYIKFAPVNGTDVFVKNGQPQNINTHHLCITCMKEYENKSLEELRYEDYLANRKGTTTTSLFGTTTPAVGNTFGQPSTSNTLFGQPAQDKPLFGQPNSTFGQPSGVFGKPQTTGFGAQPPTSNNTFAFGSAATNQSTSLFGAAKPFGAAAAPAFATPTQGNTFRPAQPTTFPGFGNIQQTGSIFGSKPPENTGFGMPQTSAAPAFGAFGQTQDSVFGAKSAVTGFGTTAPVFGAGNAFGVATSGAATGTAFPTFGAKPPETGAPGFGTFNPTSATNPGLGNTAFGGGTAGLGGFGSTGLGTSNTWSTATLSGGLNLGGNTLGANPAVATLGAAGGANAGPGVHDRIITLARAYPYGYSSLLKDISPSSEKGNDSLKPTNPAAQRAIMESDKYKVTLGVTKLKVKPLHAMSKKSLFDGLEEDDPSIQKFTLKPSVKRLVLRPKPAADNDNSNNNEVSLPYEIIDHHSNNNNGNESSVIVDASPRINSFTSAREVLSPEYISETDSQRISPSNIQKRVGLDSPRGGILKNSLNVTVTDTANDDDTPGNRRSSWLTTKSLAKWSSDVHEPRNLDNTVEQLLSSKTSGTSVEKEQEARRTLYPDLSEFSETRSTLRESRTGLLDVEDKENIINPALNDDEDISSAEARVHTPHPTGIKLTRPGYYTLPSLDDLIAYIKPDGRCVVPQFTIGRRGYGNVFYDCEMDVANLDVDQLVHIMHKEIIIYPDDDAKPAVGDGLNRPAQVTLDCVWPIDKTLKEPITLPDKLAKMDYDGKLRRVCNKHGTRFIEYRPQTGSWVFKVPHFSKYGLTNSDEEDEGQADGAQLKKPVAQPSKELPATGVIRGLGGFLPGNIPTGIPTNATNVFIDQNEHTMDSVSADTPFVSKLNGTTKGLAMDTSEENSMDSAALYPDTGHASFYASKDALSPTSQLARLENRSSHTLQLMKASFFNHDTEMDDVASVTDQLVPQLSIPQSSLSMVSELPHSLAPSVITNKTELPLQIGLSIQPPIIKPKSVVLRYHKRVLPYEKTIAGRYGNGCYADSSIALARLLRVGWGPSTHLMTITTADAAADRPPNSDLLTLSSLVGGRKAGDTSRQLVLHLQIAGGGPPNDKNKSFKDSIENFLKICLKHSELVNVEKNTQENCPYISPMNSQIEAVKEYAQEALRLEKLNENIEFGISPSYWREVWSLCLALWGEHGDPENDIKVPNGARLLGQHAALSEWLQTVATSRSDEETTVFTLLASKRVREACHLAQKQGDHFNALMLSQIGGEMRVRHLAARQLGLWKETNADRLIDPVRLVTASLLAGRSRILVSSDSNDGPSSIHVCNGLDWIRAFGLHFWYICEPVASVADAIQAFERSFYEESRLRKCVSNNYDVDVRNREDEDNENNMEYDLTTAESQDVLHGRVAFPSPPYECNLDDLDDKSVKRILDLRYQLMALRASRWRLMDSILNPASHTPDPLDHRLSWLLQQFLQSIGYSHWSERGLHNIITGFASQLQAHGMWAWSIFVLQHIKDINIRNHLVKEVVLRYAGGSENTPVRDLLQKLGIPDKWVFEAEALKAKYEGDGEMEAYYLTLSGHYAEAHKVIIDQLAPTTILNENPDALRRLLKPLKAVGDAGRIPNWTNGGHLLLEFLDICDEINLLQDGDCDSLSYQCESLRMRLASACSAVTKFPTITLKHTVARCEIGARLASIGCAIAGLDSTITRSNISPLLNLLNRMDLPSDYVRKLLDKISDSLTEESGVVFSSEAMSSSSEE
ncbi:nuclear pore complex protein Nup98-96 isoform X2 [Arctopsyche grandis]|uniref:nuclear pore complex protein Nup98-96 isoform X2 n=1 Tax=Arctopsyche grandis TaxID=121162 RepID=UPI00406D7455